MGAIALGSSDVAPCGTTDLEAPVLRARGRKLLEENALNALLTLVSEEIFEINVVAPSYNLDFVLQARSTSAAATAAPLVAAQLGPQARVTILFSGLGEDSGRFLHVSFQDTSVRKKLLTQNGRISFVAQLHDLANAFIAGFDLVSAEPDIPTDVFDFSDMDGDIGAEFGGLGPIEDVIKALCEVAHYTTPLDWAPRQVRVREAMAYSKRLKCPVGGAGIVIAQPDTGVKVHRELEGAIEPNGGWDILLNCAPAIDPRTGGNGNPGHGTATASVAASRETYDILGAAPCATLFPIRCIEDVKVFKTAPTALAIEKAIAVGADVISMSFGGLPSAHVRHAIREAVARGILVVAAAGNCIGIVVWPARYDACISVAGSSAAGAPWQGTSHWGPVAIGAPAELVWYASAKEHCPISSGQGTSFAAATTAGAAAQWLAHKTPQAVRLRAERDNARAQDLFRAALRQSATPWSDGARHCGPGIVNIEKLLALDLQAIPPVIPADIGEQEIERRIPAEFADIYAAFGGDPHDVVAFDWERYGAELAWVAIMRAIAARAAGGALEAADPIVTSAALAAAVAVTGNEALGRWVGAAA